MNIKKGIEDPLSYTGSSETTREILNTSPESNLSVDSKRPIPTKDNGSYSPTLCHDSKYLVIGSKNEEPSASKHNKTEAIEGDDFTPKQGSKAKRSFDFENYFTHGIPEHKCGLTDAHFLEWLIGFFEADGCFLMWSNKNKQNRFRIVITQKDAQLLHKLRTVIGFGSVSEYSQKGETYWRYNISDFKNLQRWIWLVNGNLITENQQHRFRNWLLEFNQTKNTTFDFINRKPAVSLETAWLSGFLEGDGGFSINSNKIIITENLTDDCGFGESKITEQCKSLNVRLTLKFSVTQKDELILLKQIQTLFCISTKLYTITNGHTDFKYNRLETTTAKSITLIIDYINKFPFLGKRHILFLRWKRVFAYRLNCYPLTKKSLKKFKRLVSNVNK